MMWEKRTKKNSDSQVLLFLLLLLLWFCLVFELFSPILQLEWNPFNTSGHENLVSHIDGVVTVLTG